MRELNYIIRILQAKLTRTHKLYIKLIMYNKINLKNIDKIQKIWHYVFLILSLDNFFLMEQIIGEFWQLWDLVYPL